jgi:hypothetical protein
VLPIILAFVPKLVLSASATSSLDKNWLFNDFRDWQTDNRANGLNRIRENDFAEDYFATFQTRLALSTSV